MTLPATLDIDKTEGPPVILIGGENNALSAARCLSRSGIEVFLLCAPEAAPRFTRHATFLPAGGRNYPSDWRSYLLSPRSDVLSGAVLMCCSDDAIAFTNADYGALSRKFVMEICPPDIRGRFLDKTLTEDCARAAGIPSPRSWRPADSAELDAAVAGMTFPVILKPRLPHQWPLIGGKYLKADDAASLRTQFKRCTELGVGVLCMEYLPGGDENNCSYYTYIDAAGEPLVHFTKRLLRRYPANKGGATYHITGWDEEVAGLGLRFFRHAGLKGLCNVEFKRDPRDGQLKLIEVNARFTAGNAVVAASGIDLATIAYNSLTGRPQDLPTTFTEGLVMCDLLQDFLAFIERRRSGELTFRTWAGQVARTGVLPVGSFHDPLPMLHQFARTSAYGAKRLSAILPGRRS